MEFDANKANEELLKELEKQDQEFLKRQRKQDEDFIKKYNEETMRQVQAMIDGKKQANVVLAKGMDKANKEAGKIVTDSEIKLKKTLDKEFFNKSTLKIGKVSVDKKDLKEVVDSAKQIDKTIDIVVNEVQGAVKKARNVEKILDGIDIDMSLKSNIKKSAPKSSIKDQEHLAKLLTANVQLEKEFNSALKKVSDDTSGKNAIIVAQEYVNVMTETLDVVKKIKLESEELINVNVIEGKIGIVNTAMSKTGRIIENSLKPVEKRLQNLINLKNDLKFSEDGDIVGERPKASDYRKGKIYQKAIDNTDRYNVDKYLNWDKGKHTNNSKKELQLLINRFDPYGKNQSKLSGDVQARFVGLLSKALSEVNLDIKNPDLKEIQGKLDLYVNKEALERALSYYKESINKGNSYNKTYDPKLETLANSMSEKVIGSTASSSVDITKITQDHEKLVNILKKEKLEAEEIVSLFEEFSKLTQDEKNSISNILGDNKNLKNLLDLVQKTNGDLEKMKGLLGLVGGQTSSENSTAPSISEKTINQTARLKELVNKTTINFEELKEILSSLPDNKMTQLNKVLDRTEELTSDIGTDLEVMNSNLGKFFKISGTRSDMSFFLNNNGEFTRKPNKNKTEFTADTLYTKGMKYDRYAIADIARNASIASSVPHQQNNSALEEAQSYVEGLERSLNAIVNGTNENSSSDFLKAQIEALQTFRTELDKTEEKVKAMSLDDSLKTGVLGSIIDLRSVFDSNIDTFKDWAGQKVENNDLKERVSLLKEIASSYDKVVDLDNKMDETNEGTKKYKKLEADLELAEEKVKDFESAYTQAIVTLNDGSKINIPLDDEFSEVVNNIISDISKIADITMVTPDLQKAIDGYEALDKLIGRTKVREDGSIIPSANKSWMKLDYLKSEINWFETAINNIKAYDPSGMFGDLSKLEKAENLLSQFNERLITLPREIEFRDLTEGMFEDVDRDKFKPEFDKMFEAVSSGAMSAEDAVNSLCDTVNKLREEAAPALPTPNAYNEKIEEIEEGIRRTSKFLLSIDSKDGVLSKYLFGKDGTPKTQMQIIEEIVTMFNKHWEKLSKDQENLGWDKAIDKYKNNLKEVYKLMTVLNDSTSSFKKIEELTKGYFSVGYQGAERQGYDEWYKESQFGKRFNNRFGETDHKDNVFWDYIEEYGNLVEFQEKLNNLREMGEEKYITLLEKEKALLSQVREIREKYKGYSELDSNNITISQNEAQQEIAQLKTESSLIQGIVTGLKDIRELIEPFSETSFISPISDLEHYNKLIKKNIDHYETFEEIQKRNENQILEDYLTNKTKRDNQFPRELGRYWEELSDAIWDSQLKGHEAIEKFDTKAKELGYTFDEVSNKWVKLQTSTPSLPLVEESSGQLAFFKGLEQTSALIEEESGQMSMFENIAEKATDIAIEGQMTLNDYIDKTIEGQMTLNDVMGKQRKTLITSRENIPNVLKATKGNRNGELLDLSIDELFDDELLLEEFLEDLSNVEKQAGKTVNKLNKLFHGKRPSISENPPRLKERYHDESFIKDIESGNVRLVKSYEEVEDVIRRIDSSKYKRNMYDLRTATLDYEPDGMKNLQQALGLFDEFGNRLVELNETGMTIKGAFITDDYAIRMLRRQTEGLDELIQKTKEAKNAGVQLAEIYGEFSTREGFYQIQEVGKGVNLFPSGSTKERPLIEEQNDALKVKDEHIQKLIQDIQKLDSLGLEIDGISGNFMYNAEKGFTAIDLSLKNAENRALTLRDILLYVSNVMTGGYGNRGGIFKDENIVKTTELMAKVKQNFLSLGYSSKDINNTFSELFGDVINGYKMINDIDNLIDPEKIVPNEVFEKLDHLRTEIRDTEKLVKENENKVSKSKVSTWTNIEEANKEASNLSLISMMGGGFGFRNEIAEFAYSYEKQFGILPEIDKISEDILRNLADEYALSVDVNKNAQTELELAKNKLEVLEEQYTQQRQIAELIWEDRSKYASEEKKRKYTRASRENIPVLKVSQAIPEVEQLTEEVQKLTQAEIEAAQKAKEIGLAFGITNKNALKEIQNVLLDYNKNSGSTLKTDENGFLIAETFEDEFDLFTNTSVGLTDVLDTISKHIKSSKDNVDAYIQSWKEVRKYVSSSKIAISDKVKSEFGDDFNRMRTTIGMNSLTTDGSGTDVITFLSEMNAHLGTTFDLTRSNQDAFIELYEFLKNKPLKINPDSLPESIRDIVNQILDGTYSQIDQKQNSSPKIKGAKRNNIAVEDKKTKSKAKPWEIDVEAYKEIEDLAELNRKLGAAKRESKKLDDNAQHWKDLIPLLEKKKEELELRKKEIETANEQARLAQLEADKKDKLSKINAELVKTEEDLEGARKRSESHTIGDEFSESKKYQLGVGQQATVKHSSKYSEKQGEWVDKNTVTTATNYHAVIKNCLDTWKRIYVLREEISDLDKSDPLFATKTNELNVAMKHFSEVMSEKRRLSDSESKAYYSKYISDNMSEFLAKQDTLSAEQVKKAEEKKKNAIEATNEVLRQQVKRIKDIDAKINDPKNNIGNIKDIEKLAYAKNDALNKIATFKDNADTTKTDIGEVKDLVDAYSRLSDEIIKATQLSAKQLSSDDNVVRIEALITNITKLIEKTKEYAGTSEEIDNITASLETQKKTLRETSNILQGKTKDANGNVLSMSSQDASNIYYPALSDYKKSDAGFNQLKIEQDNKLKQSAAEYDNIIDKLKLLAKYYGALQKLEKVSHDNPDTDQSEFINETLGKIQTLSSLKDSMMKTASDNIFAGKWDMGQVRQYQDSLDKVEKAEFNLNEQRKSFTKESQSSAIDEYKNKLKELSQAYKQYGVDSAKDKGLFSIQADYQNIERINTELEGLSQKAQQAGVSVGELSKIKDEAFKNISNNLKDNIGTSALDNFSKQIETTFSRMTENGTITSESMKLLSDLQLQLNDFQKNSNLDSEQGINSYLSGIEYYAKNLPSQLKQIEAAGKYLTEFDNAGGQIGIFESFNLQAPKATSLLKLLKQEYQSLSESLKNSNGQFVSKEQIDQLTRIKALIAEFGKEAQGKGTLIPESIGKVTDAASLNDAMKKYASSLGYTKQVGQAVTQENGQLTISFKNAEGQILKMTGSIDALNQGLRETSTVSKGTVGFITNLKVSFKQMIGYFTRYYTGYTMMTKAISAFRGGINIVKEFDAAMTELHKVSNDTEAALARFGKEAFNIAETIGSTGKEIINSAADWEKLGYAIEDASELAKNSALYSNVGDMDIDTATEHMVSTLKAYKEFDAQSSQLIVDKFNEIGNNYAITSEGIGSALERAAATLVAANNDLDESIALITAGNIITQNPESVGNAIKVVSMRLRGAKEELESAGEETDGLVESTSKLQKKIMALTGVDIMLDDSTFKSTYEILLEISKVWDDLSDISRANVLEVIAGKTRGSVVAGLLQQGDTLESAYKDSQDAEGSALKENERYLQSIQGHLDKMNNQWQKIWTSDLSRETMNWFIDAATGLLKIVEKIGLVASTVIAGSLITTGKALIKTHKANGGGRAKKSALIKTNMPPNKLAER